MAHIPLRNGHKFNTILALSCKLSLQAKLIFHDGGSDVQNRVGTIKMCLNVQNRMGTLHIKMCSDVPTRVGTPHIRICSDVKNRVGTPHIKMCSDVQNRVGTLHIKVGDGL